MRHEMALLVAGLLALSLTAAADQSVPPTLRFQEQRLGSMPSPSDIVTTISSADGCHLAMVVTRQGKHLVVVDGQAGPEYDGFGKGTLVFSADGKRVAYGAQKGEKWLVVVDGQAGPEYDGIVEGGPVFSADGKRVAYGAVKGKKQLVVVDGQAGPEYDGIKGGPTFHAAGTLECLARKSGGLYRITHEP